MDTYKLHDAVAQVVEVMEAMIGRNQICHTMLGSLDTSDQKRIFVAPCKCIVKKIYLITETTLAANTSDYRHFRPVNVSVPGYLFDEVPAPRSTYYAGHGIVADTPWEIWVNENTSLAALDVIELYMDTTGSPAALEECSVLVVYSFCEEDEV